MIGTFTKNTLITFISRGLIIIMGLITSIIIARVLGPKGLGIYSVAILLYSLLITFTNFGIESATVFCLKKNYPLKEILGNTIILSGLSSLFTILIGLIVIFFFQEKFFPGIEKIYLFSALSLIPFTFFFYFVSSFLLGLQQIKKYNLVSLIQTFFFLILVAVLLFGLHFGITITIFAQVLSFLLAGIILFLFAKKEAQGLSIKINKQYFKDIFGYGFKVYLVNIFSFLHFRADQFMINIFMNPLAVGFYALAVKFSEGIWLLSTSAATVIFPKVTWETNVKNLKEFTPLVCRNVLFVTLLISILLFLFGNWVIKLFYSDKFLESVRPFQILLIGTLAFSGWRILAYDIYAREKPMLNTWITGFSTVLNIILNIIYIPKFGIAGAAWTTTISYSVMLIITIFFYGKMSGNKAMDIIFIKKSDFIFYKKFIFYLKDIIRKALILRKSV